MNTAYFIRRAPSKKKHRTIPTNKLEIKIELISFSILHHFFCSICPYLLLLLYVYYYYLVILLLD